MGAPVHLVVEEEREPAWVHPFAYPPYNSIRFAGLDEHGRALYRCPWMNPKRLYTGKRALSLAAKKFGSTCIYCNAKTGHKATLNDMGEFISMENRLTVDHVVPLYLGGKNELANYLISCAPCNNKKGHIPVEDFAPSVALMWRLACEANGYFPLTFPTA